MASLILRSPFRLLFRFPNEMFGLPKWTPLQTDDLLKKAIDFLNRNAREPKKANHGARPCSSVMRRLKKKSYYRRTRENIVNDPTAEKLE